MSQKKIRIRSKGLVVNQILSKTDDATTASVMGVASHGLYIQIDRHWVIFLSYDNYRGPLTLNLEADKALLREIDHNSPVDIRKGIIDFTGTGIQINHSDAVLWDSRRGDNAPLSLIESNARIRAVGEEIYRQRKDVGFAPFLPILLEFDPSEAQQSLASFGGLDFEKLQMATRQADISILVMEMSRILGLGMGLTPSGDDLLVGFLIALNRYPDVLNPTFDLSQLNSAIVRMAYQKTSLLSANLIECASLGQANERLTQALDGIMAGSLTPGRCVELILGWGNSSGVDTFVGFALAAYQRPDEDLDS